MEDPSNTPRPHSRPPAVDFIDNRLQKYHAAFVNPPVHFDSVSESYIPDCKALALRGDVRVVGPASVVSGSQSASSDDEPFSRPAWTSTNAMVFWSGIFPDALARFRTSTAEPKGQSKTDYSIRNEDNWDSIYGKLEMARKKYQDEGGKVGRLRKVWRKAADHVAPATETAKTAAKAVPHNEYSTPVLGAVQLLFDAVKAAASVRGQALQGLEGLIPIFSDVELFLATFPRDAGIHNASVELTVATLQAIEHVIGFFISNDLLRGVKALGMGEGYGSKLVQSLEEIRTRSRSLMEEAAKSHMFEFHTYSRETRMLAKQTLEQQKRSADRMDHIYNLLTGHIEQRDREIAIASERHRREIEAAQQEIVLLRVENGRLRSLSAGSQDMVPLRPQGPAQLEPHRHVSQAILRQMMNSGDVNVADAAFVADMRGELPARERAQVEQMVNAQRFQDWIMSPCSAKLLVHWDRRRPKTFTGVSPLSVFCGSMAQMLRANDRFVALLWFCGRHMDPTESSVGGRAMLASLVDQLLRQHAFDTYALAADMDIGRLQLCESEELARLLEWLVYGLPETVTLVCLIDGVILYERDEMDALPVFSRLVRLAANNRLRAAVKLLFTSTPGTDIVRTAFEQEDSIMDIDRLPRVAWAPSDERMERELGFR